MSPNLTPTPPGGAALGEPLRHSAISAPAPYVGGDPAREYLQFVFGVLRRRCWFVVCFVAVVAAFATFVVSEIKPLYQSETQLVLEAAGGRSAASGLQALLGGGSDLENETEAAILTSLTLAERVINKLNLQQLPFFGGVRPTASPLASAWQELAQRIAEQLPEEYREFVLPAPTKPTAEVANPAYERFFRSLVVRPGDRSRVLTIRFSADDPRLAATIANTLAETYIGDQVEARRKSSSRETRWLDERLEELRTRVNDAQRKVEEFRTANGVYEASGSTTLQRRILEYNQQLMAAQLRRTELEGRAKQLQQLARTGATGADDSAAALESTNVQRLREQEVAAARKVAELGAQYRDDHPRMQQAKAELDDVHAKIEAELRRLVGAATNQARLAREQEGAIAAKLDDLSGDIQRQAAVEVNLRLLEAEFKTTTQLYESVLNRTREAQAMAMSADAPPVRVISRAVPADRPFFPNKPLLIGAATAIATLIGILLAFVLEFLDIGFRNRGQIENLTGLETVASIPRLPRLVRARRLSDMQHVLRTQPAFAEAVRYIRVSLSLSPETVAPARTMLVTSSLSGEGKTFTSRALAVSFAMGGKRVITIDCDLRQRPRTWSRRTDALKKPGLADFLVGTADVDAIIGVDPATSLHHIGCGDTQPSADAPILLESKKMRQLLRALAEKYDMVILDTPPLRMFPDALVLQQHVDKVLFLAQWAKTRREVALDALKSIVQSGHLNPVVGLTQVDPRQVRRYEYATRISQRYGDPYPTRREAA